MEKWIAVATFAITVAGFIWAASRLWQKMNSRMDVMETKQAGQDAKHKDHYASIGELTTALHVLGTQMTDHAERDDERFGRIDEYMAETRTDIKAILRAVGGKK